MYALWFTGEKIIELSGLKSIYNSAECIIDTLKWIRSENSSNSQCITKVTRDRDLNTKLKSISLLSKELENNQIKTISSISYCISQLEESITDVEFCLECIKSKVHKYESSWFSVWKPNMVKMAKDLDEKCSILENRFETLSKVVSVHSNVFNMNNKSLVSS